jgi:hypothetical protein
MVVEIIIVWWSVAIAVVVQVAASPGVVAAIIMLV